jgi:hypothetical protein
MFANIYKTEEILLLHFDDIKKDPLITAGPHVTVRQFAITS